MSGKNPSRSCEDVDEAALSYAEVKALASGDPRIMEKTELDGQVTKLKLLKANHENQRYALEDKLIKFYPQAIKREQELIAALEADISDFESVSTSIKQMEHRMEQIAALKTHIINYAKTRDTYAAYRRTKAADKPAFRTAHEADLLLHEAAKRAFDAQGVKKLPTVKVLQAEYTELLTKKKAAYEDYKRLRKENQELQAVKSNVDTLLRIEEEPQEKKQEQHR